MIHGLIRRANNYFAGLNAIRDYQVSNIINLEHEFLSSNTITPGEASQLVKKLERRWGVMVIQIYPEYKFYDDNTLGESWAVSKRVAAINIPVDYLYPYTVVHEYSHCVVECFREFHTKTLKEPGHGPLWAGVYKYNMAVGLQVDMTDLFEEHKIKTVSPDIVADLKTFFRP